MWKSALWVGVAVLASAVIVAAVFLYAMRAQVRRWDLVAVCFAATGAGVSIRYYFAKQQDTALHGLTERNALARAGYRLLDKKLYLDDDKGAAWPTTLRRGPARATSAPSSAWSSPSRES